MKHEARVFDVTSRCVYIQQDSYTYIKICIYTLRSVQFGHKETMTAGSIIVFSNGDRKMAANDEAIFFLLRRVYRAMTEEMTSASNVEEELSRVFFPKPLVNYGRNGSGGKTGRLRSGGGGGEHLTQGFEILTLFRTKIR